MSRLVLTRKCDQSIVIPALGISITISEIRKGKYVQLVVEAPREVAVYRDEVWARIKSEKDLAA